MLGRVRGRGAEEAEALVQERLRSILAAATPRGGWVPERIGRTGDPVETPDVEPSSSPSPAVGKHRGDAASSMQVRWDPGRPAALALCLVAVLAGLLTAGIMWWSRPQPSSADQTGLEPMAAGTARVADGPAPPGAPAGQSDSADSDPALTTGSTQDQLVVSVIGQVHRPGLVTVAGGARVADAITAAGGALPEADLSTVNLARLVVDGEQIAVGIPGSSLPGDADPTASGGLVDLNTATLAELETLPGIGPVLAQRIIDFREDNGGFTAVEQLREVSGIGPTVYEDIVDLVTV
ncbi:MAG: helix-hairpin-helix domain-containing protein [Geodermatophilaceae bacterium]